MSYTLTQPCLSVRMQHQQALESFRCCEALSQRHPSNPSLPPKSASQVAETPHLRVGKRGKKEEAGRHPSSMQLMLPAHRDEPRCESEGQLYYLPCIIRKAHTYPHKLRGTPRVESPILSHRRRSPNGDPRYPGARPPAAQGYEPQAKRTAAMGGGPVDGFGLVMLGWRKYGPKWSSTFRPSSPDHRPSGPPCCTLPSLPLPSPHGLEEIMYC